MLFYHRATVAEFAVNAENPGSTPGLAENQKLLLVVGPADRIREYRLQDRYNYFFYLTPSTGNKFSP